MEEKIDFIQAPLDTYAICYNNNDENPHNWFILRVWVFRAETYSHKIKGSVDMEWATMLIPICGDFQEGYESWDTVNFVGTKEECEKRLNNMKTN
jgi:hypothetical protein